LKDLKGLPLVLQVLNIACDNSSSERHDRALFKLKIAIEMNSLRQIAALVSRASAYTIMPRSAMMDEISDGELVLVPIEPAMRRTAYLIRNRNRPVTRANSSVGKLVPVILKDMVVRRGLRAKLLQ